MPEVTESPALDRMLVDALCNRLFSEESFTERLLNDLYRTAASHRDEIFSESERQRLVSYLMTADSRLLSYVSDLLAERLGRLEMPVADGRH